MAIPRKGLRSSKPKPHDKPIESHGTPPAADDSDDDDDDNDDIPRKTIRPPSSGGSRIYVSLGRPTPKQLEGTAPTTRSRRTSLPLQTQEAPEQPSKRRKTEHDDRDDWAIASSPAPQAKGDANDEDDLPPGFMEKLHGALQVGISRATPREHLSEIDPATAPEEDAEVDGDGHDVGDHSWEVDEQMQQVDEEAEADAVDEMVDEQAGEVEEQVEDANDSLFVQQEVVEDDDDEDVKGRDDMDVEGDGRAADDDAKDADYKEPSTVESEAHHTVSPGKPIGENEPEARGTNDVDEGSAMMDGVEAYELEDFEDREAPSAERFMEDLADFNQRHQEDEVFMVPFTAPPEDNFEDAHMKFEQFRLIVLRMKEETWTGYLGATWVKQRMETYFDPYTTPGKTLFSIVRKFESLCAAVPEAPKLRSQTRFLQKHESIISHYLSQLVAICQHICHVRLATPQVGAEVEPGIVIERREQILNEAFRIHVPMLLQCSNVIWKLTGREDKNCFTKGTLDLLEAFLQAAKQECKAIIRVLRSSSRGSNVSSRPNPLDAERLKQAKSAIETLVYAINNIKQTRETLAENGEKRVIRQQKQMKLQAQLERNRLATQAQLNEIEARRASMPSTQDTSITSSQPRTSQAPPPAPAPIWQSQKRLREQPLAATQSSTQRDQHPRQRELLPLQKDRPRSQEEQLPATATTQRPAQRDQTQRPVQLAQRARGPFGSPPRQAYEGRYRAWNVEEQNFLLREIRKAYIAVRKKPQLPDIDGYIRKELNRPISDILHQTEALATLLFRKVKVLQDEVELEGLVQKLMNTYDGVGRLPSVRNGERDEDVWGRD